MSWQENTENFNALHIGFKIFPAENKQMLFQPEKIEVGISPAQQNEKLNHQVPFPYYTDALVGLAAHKVLAFSNNSSFQSAKTALCALLWEKLEPMHSIYHRSNERLKPLLETKYSTFGKTFESNIKEILRDCCEDKKLNFKSLGDLINAISFLEKKIEAPLLFNRSLLLPHSTMDILHTLYSLLYNLRALVAMEHNAHVQEMCYDGLKLDPITDYLPNVENNVNDSLLFYHWSALSQHQPHQSSHFHESMEQAFRNFTYYGYNLMKALPAEFFKQKQIDVIEQGLYMFQVDWLLGSPSGLLFRLKEELYGLKESYEKIFWSDLHKKPDTQVQAILEAQCTISPDQLKKLSEAA
jgi:hypothetical protein